MCDDVDAAAAGDGAGPDFISDLPDHLLLTMLCRVPTVEAIRNCLLLSPRWHTLWTHLPALRFFDNDDRLKRLHFPELVDTALRRCHAASVSRLEISVSQIRNIDTARFAAWIAFAAERVTGRFLLTLQLLHRGYDGRIDLDLPCFPKAKSVNICLANAAPLRIPGPDAGTFASLLKLDLGSISVSDGGAALSAMLSSSCPLLELVRLMQVSGLRELVIRSSSLVEVQLLLLKDLELLEVAAATLLRFNLAYCFVGKIGKCHTAVSIISPILCWASWLGPCPEAMHFVGCKRHLMRLTVVSIRPGVMENKDTRILGCFLKAASLRFQLSIPLDVTGHLRYIEQLRLPYCLELDLCVARNGHAVGAGAIPMLKRCDFTRKITCYLINTETAGEWNQCLPDCACRDPTNWWLDEEVCLESLVELEFHNLIGTEDEHMFLYFIYRQARWLRSVKISVVAQADDDGYMICNNLGKYVPPGCLASFSVMRSPITGRSG